MVSTSEIVAFRLNAHHLTKRVAGDGLLEATGRCGAQNSPPGSALLALHARVRDVTQERMAAAIAEDKSLMQTWSMRGAPFFFPTVDAPVFTTGVSPPTEEAMRHFIPGVEPAIAKLDISLTEAVGLCGAEIHVVLSGRRLAINELGRELAGRVASRLTTGQSRIWEGEGPYAPNQSLGEGVVHFCIRILTLQRKVCFAPRVGNQAPSSWSTSGWATRFRTSTRTARVPNCFAATCAATDPPRESTSPRGWESILATPAPGGTSSRRN